MMRFKGSLLAGAVLALALQLLTSGTAVEPVQTQALNWPKCC
ncbi:MAG: hypothetical protein AB7I24_09725 [Candidatus Nanopelagicales bacterium]|jgi:hypothetical protein